MKEITQQVLIQKTLQQEKNSGGRGEMWVSLDEQIILIPFELKKVDLHSMLCWFTLLRKDDTYSELFNKSREIKCFFPGAGVYIFTTCYYFCSDSSLLKTNFPIRMYAKERRRDERQEVDGKLSLKFITESGSRTFKVFDISKGGISIILSRAEHFNFEQNTVFDVVIMPFSIKLRLQQTLKLKIKPFVLENIPYAGHKLSFRFIFETDLKRHSWEKMWEQSFDQLFNILKLKES